MEEEKKEKKVEPVSEIVEEKKNALDVISRAAETASRLEAANAKTEELLRRQENLHAMSMLGGRTEAGQKPEIKKEETEREYADKLFKGLSL